MEEKTLTKICLICKNKFETLKAQQRYCSTSCGTKACKRQYLQPKFETVIDVVDCIPTSDVAYLNKMRKERTLDIDMLIRRVKLRAEMEPRRIKS